MQKIFYIANVRLPTEKAHGIQIMEMCHAFATQGVELELVVPNRKNHITQETFAYFGMSQRFRITRLWTLDLVQQGPLGFLIQSLTFMCGALRYVLTRGENVLVYSRDDLFLFFWSFTGRPYAYEIHAPKWHFVSRRAIRRASKIICISNGLREFYVRKGVVGERLFVAPDGVNLERFLITETRAGCRKKLGLPQDKKIVLYSGHLYERKGAHSFARAANFLSDDVLCIFVGGTEKDIAAFKEEFGGEKNILILGHRPHQDIPYFLRAADVLVLPNSAKDEDSKLYTSPMKLFEYMASGTPIVASHVPSIREVLNDEDAFWFPSDNSTSMAKCLLEVLKDEVAARERANAALLAVKKYDWRNRSKNIIGILNFL